jgi:hypothetical protein
MLKGAALKKACARLPLRDDFRDKLAAHTLQMEWKRDADNENNSR